MAQILAAWLTAFNTEHLSLLSGLSLDLQMMRPATDDELLFDFSTGNKKELEVWEQNTDADMEIGKYHQNWHEAT